MFLNPYREKSVFTGGDKQTEIVIVPSSPPAQSECSSGAESFVTLSDDDIESITVQNNGRPVDTSTTIIGGGKGRTVDAKLRVANYHLSQYQRILGEIIARCKRTKKKLRLLERQGCSGISENKRHRRNIHEE
jgi:hypothetical protein